jgi:predicted nucleotidyltransferase component of viral defense system
MSIVKSWHRKQMTQEIFRKIQQKTGIPARLVEITFWHIDTLGLLSSADWLIFKGGTCVQTYLPSGYQRASVDLDFNSEIENPNSIKDEINNLNEKIKKDGALVEVEGIEFGTLEYKSEDEYSGTINYSRRMPSRFGERERIGEYTIQAKSIRVQINHKHSWLPAVKKIKKEPRFFIMDYQKPRYKIKLKHSSAEDLVVDKILATSNIGPFGRERFKDAYDLGMLFKNKLNLSLVHKKLDLIGRRSKQKPKTIVDGSIDTISYFSINTQEVLGFAAMVGKDGRGIIENWEEFCLNTIEELKKLN